ncbi:MAG: metal-dependent transcriptional regulator, partial [Candidatus Odinarchaeia archaeon]
MSTIREEQYLEKIGEIVNEKGYAKIKDISRKLNLVPSTVTEMMKRLEGKNFIKYEKYGAVTLTELGRKKIQELDEKHKTLKKFFMIIGLDEETAEKDACIIEHVI